MSEPAFSLLHQATIFSKNMISIFVILITSPRSKNIFENDLQFPTWITLNIK